MTTESPVAWHALTSEQVARRLESSPKNGLLQSVAAERLLAAGRNAFPEGKQRSLLAKQGINPDGVSFSQGRQLISEIFRRWDGNLCSFKQAKVLRRYGCNTEVSFGEASATIDALARNGWKRPEVSSQGAEVSGERSVVSNQ